MKNIINCRLMQKSLWTIYDRMNGWMCFVLARNKAVFDADILFHLIETEFIDSVIELFDTVFVSDYVYDVEVKKNTAEAKKLEKLKNSDKLKILEYGKLTDLQKMIYRETIKVIEKSSTEDQVNEGEKITASFAKAHNIYYYMSDDNKAAPHIWIHKEK